MIVRNDLKNSTNYKQIEAKYKKNDKKEMKSFLFWLLPELILISVFSCFSEQISILHTIIVCLPLTLFFYFGYVFYCHFKLKEKYEIYQITVGKKITKKVYGVDGVNQYFIKDIDSTNKNIYTINDIGLFDRINENQTYIFLAKEKVLYTILF